MVRILQYMGALSKYLRYWVSDGRILREFNSRKIVLLQSYCKYEGELKEERLEKEDSFKKERTNSLNSVKYYRFNIKLRQANAFSLISKLHWAQDSKKSNIKIKIDIQKFIQSLQNIKCLQK